MPCRAVGVSYLTPTYHTSTFASSPSPCSNILTPRRTSLREHLRCDDEGFLDFLAAMLVLDPARRPSATVLLQHPWMREENALPFESYVVR